MTEAVDVAVQLKSDRIREEAQAENQQFLDSIDEGMKKVIKEQVKSEVSKITPQIKKLVNEQLESEVLVRSSKEAKTSHAVAANLSELELKKILIDKMEANKSISRSDIQRQLYKALVEAYKADKILLDTYGDTALREKTTTIAGKTTTGSKTHKQSASQSASQSAPVEETMQSTDVFEEPAHQEFETGDHDEQIEEESVPADHESVQPWLSTLARRQGPRELFDELTDTTFDFSAFVMNRLNVTALTPEVLAGLTFELMKGTCKSLTELEYFCEEVYKATTEKLDWINPEGRQYPHDLRKPLPLVPNSQGRHVIPFHHFINNDLEYLRGGESSRKYSTSVTKTKAADYGHIKWIEDLVPNSMWSQVIVNYDKFALWGISHWGKKRRQFYAFATTRESARDVYSKRRIIAVTKVEIVEWQNYKHLDWITVRRDDDILYKFKEGDFHRLRIQDIEDMLLLLVQGKLTNLNVEERLAFNVSLRMFTRSVVIQRRVEDLQLGVESYQKKLNLTKPDTYRSNLRRRDAYTPYSDPRGFIYENKDKKNRLMCIDELHKFSDGTLDDVWTALNNRFKGIKMEYLPQTFWSQRDKANARAMIQSIDKRLKTWRIMRSLERFVGGRPYEEHAEYDESNTYVLERFNTTAGNPVKKILLKLNLSDHRLFKDGRGEMLQKFGLEDSKPMKTPISSDTKLTTDEECKLVDSTKYRGMIGNYVDRKSTSGICTFVGCCLTSWFSKKQTALAISTTEAEYISARKACQQALWMKQALIDYDVRLDDVPIIQFQLSYSDKGQIFVEFMIQNQLFSLALEDFAQILRIPCEGACVFSDRWSLNELVYGAPTEGPYQTNLPSPDDIISYVREDREGLVTRVRHQEEVEVQEY
ncbi:hypothetical protein Tco_0952191 [Tanacetum coccineum]|uniref:Copia protein n=1 Tax=Tanacetum coccineum TaxID=301880 RepID=A0ABQ5DWA3_9ASTR